MIQMKQSADLATLEEHQTALGLLLKEFDRICRQLDIPYYLFAGTLLGAVRHQGFIPWDDDLDVLMLRKDYIRFMREAPAILDSETFYLQEEFSQHWPMFFSKLRINGTTCLEKYNPKDPQIHQGVYMDIFPLDNAFHSAVGRYVQFLCSKVVIAKGLYQEGYVTDSIVKKIVMQITRVLPRDVFHRIVRGPKKTGKYVHCFLGGARKFSRSVFCGKWFANVSTLPFGGADYLVPACYDKLLHALYDDYMSIPLEEDRRIKKHAILVDLNRSWEEYAHYRDGMKFDVYTRSIR